MGYYSAQAAAARARILNTEVSISGHQDRIPKVTEALSMHKSKCEAEASATQAYLQLVQRDLATLAKVVNGTSCPAAAALLRCAGARGAFLTVEPRPLRSQALRLQSR